MLSFAHKSGKPCGKERKSEGKPLNFNAMMRFALFWCNGWGGGKLFAQSQEDFVRM
jgi:hypothetical protein